MQTVDLLDLYQRVTRELEAHFRRLESHPPKPRPIEIGNMVAFRYEDPSLEAALIQRLARLVSGLGGARILLGAGYVQEAAAVQRMIDEFEEDIWFLAQPLLGGARTPLHDRFLSEFFLDDFPDRESLTLESMPARSQIPRKRIRAAVVNWKKTDQDSSSRILDSKVVSTAYSGFIHGLSSRTMEMYFGEPPRFHVSGMRDSQAADNHTKDLWNQIFRGCMATEVVALAFGDQAEARSLRELRNRFETESGGPPVLG